MQVIEMFPDDFLALSFHDGFKLTGDLNFSLCVLLVQIFQFVSVVFEDQLLSERPVEPNVKFDAASKLLFLGPDELFGEIFNDHLSVLVREFYNRLLDNLLIRTL